MIEEIKCTNDPTIVYRYHKKNSGKKINTLMREHLKEDNMEHEKHAYEHEPTVVHNHHGHTEGESSMFTNPALPVVTGAGFGGFGGGFPFVGFQPADAALVQSNNLAIITNQIAMGFQLLNQNVSDNSKQDALIGKDNQIAMKDMQNNMMMMFMQMQSKLDHIACCACPPTPQPTARG